MAVKKTKKEHCDRLQGIQRGMRTQIAKVSKEAHIPIWLLRTWAADITSTASFMRKEMRQDRDRKDRQLI